jgi:hypothetical protein
VNRAMRRCGHGVVDLSQLPKDGDVTDCILAIEEADQAPSENYFVGISLSQEAAIDANAPPCTESVVPNL